MKSIHAKLTVMMCCYYVSMLILSNYLPRYLRDFGYSDFKVGLAVMWYMLSALLCQLVLGYFADKFSFLKQMMIAGFVAVTLSFPLLFVFSGSAAVAVLFFVFALGPWRALTGILDSWVARAESVDYGKVRGSGAIAYAVFSVLLGQLFAVMGNIAAVYAMAVVSAVMLNVLLSMKNPEKLQTSEKMTVREPFAYLAKNRVFLFLLIGTFAHAMTLASVTTYLPVSMTDMGGTQAQLGVAFFIMAAIEFAVMSFAGRLSARVGCVALLAIGYLGSFAKNIAFAAASDIRQVYLACLINCLSIPFVVPGTLLYMSEHVDHRYLSTAVLVNESILCVSMMIANPLFGMLTEKFGASRMFAYAGLPSFLVGIFFVVLRKKSAA